MKTEMRALIIISILVMSLFSVGCIAGGSGLYVKAKKSSKTIIVVTELSAFGDANLKNYDTCFIYYGARPSGKGHSEVQASVIARKKKCVSWQADFDASAFKGDIYLTTKMYSSRGKSMTFQSDWKLDVRKLNGSYQPVKSL